MKTTNNGDYIYMTIPKEFYYIYKELLIRFSNLGIDIIKDCNKRCANSNKQLYDCWILFYAACASYQENTIESIKKASFMFNYIKKQLNIKYVDSDNNEIPQQGEIIILNTRETIGHDGGTIRIEYQTKGDVGSVLAQDSSYGQFNYEYGPNYIDVVALPYEPDSTEEFDIVIKGTNGGYCIVTIIRLPKEKPYVKISINNIELDYLGFDESGNEIAVPYEISGNVGNIYFETDSDWINCPSYVEGDPNEIPIILKVNNSIESRVGHIYIKTSKGYSDFITIIQKGEEVNIYKGVRDTSPVEETFTDIEILNSNKVKLINDISIISIGDNAKCKWWAIPKDTINVVHIYDDLNEDNLQYAKIDSININDVAYDIYYLWSPIASTTNYNAILQYG